MPRSRLRDLEGWLSAEGRELAQERANIHQTERRIRHLIGLLLASGQPAHELRARLPSSVARSFARELGHSSAPDAAVPVGLAQVPAPIRTRRALSERQARILAIAEDAGQHGADLTAADIELRLRAHGDLASINAVRKALARLVERDLVIKTARSRYAVPAVNATHHEQEPVRQSPPAEESRVPLGPDDAHGD